MKILIKFMRYIRKAFNIKVVKVYSLYPMTGYKLVKLFKSLELQDHILRVINPLLLEREYESIEEFIDFLDLNYLQLYLKALLSHDEQIFIQLNPEKLDIKLEKYNFSSSINPLHEISPLN